MINYSWHNLITWSQDTYSHLPWRQRRSLYTTLISELMLQQTTVAVVSQRWEGFMAQFPSWQALHQASQESILAAWQGLGYYQRARNLYRLAQQYTCEQEFSADLLAGIKQPGIGPYTRGALLSIGLNTPAAALDANIRRVLSRLYGQDFDEAYQQLLTAYEPRALNEALMDLGRTFCQSRQARCKECFLKQSCQTACSGTIIAPQARQSRPTLTLLRLYCYEPNYGVLGAQKSPGKWLEGYVELPTLLIDGETEQYQPLSDTALIPAKEDWRFVSQITKYRLVNLVYCVSLAQAREILGEEESFYDFYGENALWATAAHKTIKHFEKQR